MSSSTRQQQQTGGNDDCDFDHSADKSSGFKRWSRNLSAQRQRELNRLNQIERRRQFLELRRQNDLFDQMSATVSHPQNVESGHNGPSLQSPKANEPIQEQQQAGFEKQTADSITNQAKNENINDEPSKVTPALTSPLSDNELREKSLDKVVVRSRSSPSVDDDDGECEGDSEGNVESQEPRATIINDQGRQMTALKEDNKLRGPLDSALLARFVSCQVPKNKRVLCLIVRDKLSRLSKTKSYFYPTYYLFVQAIVDIDDVGFSFTGTCASGRTSVAEQQHQQNLIDSSPPSQAQKRRDLSQAADSVDCSFSASSSISADMLFIGGGSNGCAPAVSASAQATGLGSGGANESQVVVPSGNSYSDNEIRAASDEDEDPYPAARTSSTNTAFTTRPTTASSGFKVKSPNGNLMHGRNSPLVFPNGTGAGAAADLRTKPEAGRSSESDERWLRMARSNNEFSDDDADTTSDNEVPSSRENRWAKSWIRSGHANSSTGNSKSTGNSISTRLVADEFGNNNLDRANDCAVATNVEASQLFDNERNPYTGTYGVLLASRRRKKAKTYLIGPNEHGYTRKNCICELKSNVLGTQFNAIRLGVVNQQQQQQQQTNADANDRFNIATISYETNVLGFKGPRKMRVLLAKDDAGRGVKNLAEIIKRDPSTVVQLKNMTPSWNIESQSYVLNFHGRVTQASVKNFQLIESEMDHSPASSDGGRQAHETVAPPGQNFENQQQMGKVKKSTNPLQQNSAFHDASESAPDHLSSSKYTSEAHGKQSKKREQVDEEEEIDLESINAGLQLNNEDMRNSLLNDHKNLTYNSSIVMQFGRISNHEFTCDVAYPLSILQAFSIALSSFDSKLACE